jgi:hypothetical protein
MFNFFWLSICVSMCNVQKRQNPSLRGVHVGFVFPIVRQDGTMFSDSNYFNIYYYGDLRMYELAYMFDSSAHDSLVLGEHRSNYFVFHKDSSFGYSFNFKGDFPVRKYSVDSLLQEQALQNFQWASITKETAPHSIVNDSAGNQTETYVPEYTKNGSPRRDSLIFYYSASMNHIPFSFSRELDSTRGSKLYKIRLFNDSTRFGPDNIFAPRRENYFEMKDLKVDNEDQLKDIFRLYQERIK